MQLSHDPSMAQLDIYPEEIKTYVSPKNLCMLHHSSFFVIAKNWEQSKCPSVGKWLNKQWYF